MSKRAFLLELFKEIADAIRSKTGDTRTYEIEELPDRIMDISTGATTPTQTKSVEIVANGTESVVPDAGYVLSKVDINVNVPQNNKNNGYFEYKNGYKIYESLISVDFSSFDTSKGTNMKYMFSKCSSLASLDLSSFNTSNVTSMEAMFLECFALVSVDLSSFDTSQVTNMDYMFYGCSVLSSLDLSSFNTSNVTSMSSMFQYCAYLESLTLGANWASNEKIKSISISNSNLTHDSCLDVFNKLATRTNSPTLQLSSGTKALMSADEIKIATDKGWVVA